MESKVVSAESNACRKERCEIKLEKELGPGLKSYLAEDMQQGIGFLLGTKGNLPKTLHL